MKYYYANAQNQAAGPVSIEELEQFLKSGVVSLSTQIIAEGGDQWSPLASLLAPSRPGGPQTIEAAATRPADVAGLCLEWVRIKTGPDGFNQAMRFFTGAGQFVILIGACIAFIYAIMLSFKTNSFRLFIGGVAALIVILVLQFIAKICLEGCKSLINASPSRIPNLTILNSAALLIIIGALGSVILGLVLAISENNFIAFLIPLVLGCANLFVAWVALHPSIVSVSLGETSIIGEEASGLLSFGLKACLAVIPYIFFIFAVSGTLSLFFCLINAQTALPVLRLPLPGWLMQFDELEGAVAGFAALISAAVLPFVAYSLLLVIHLLVDLIRSILSIRGRSDSELRK